MGNALRFMPCGNNWSHIIHAGMGSLASPWDSLRSQMPPPEDALSGCGVAQGWEVSGKVAKDKSNYDYPKFYREDNPPSPTPVVLVHSYVLVVYPSFPYLLGMYGCGAQSTLSQSYISYHISYRILPY